MFLDELDDFDSQVPVTKTLLEIFCELISDTNTYLVQEPIVKSLLVLFGRPIEHHLDVQSEKMLRNIKKLIGKLPETSNQLPMAMKLAFMVECCFEILPGNYEAITSIFAIMLMFFFFQITLTMCWDEKRWRKR